MSLSQLTVLDELREIGEIFARLHASQNRLQTVQVQDVPSQQAALQKLEAITAQAEIALTELSASHERIARTLEELRVSGRLAEVEESVAARVRFTVRLATPILEAVEVLQSGRPPSDSERLVLRLINSGLQEEIRSLRITLLYFPDMIELLTPQVLSLALTVRTPWWAYLRSMWNMLWSAILHPLSDTTIDLSTGRVLYRT